MAMKPETKYYVLLGKTLSAVKNSAVLGDANISFVLDETAEEIIFSVAVNGKVFGYTLPLNSTKEENEILDELMGIYNVHL